MYCGYLKQTCKSITVKDLIEILKLCKNPDASIQLLGTTNFFVHFDKEGSYINFTKSPETSSYGSTTGGNCTSCTKFNKSTNSCNCDGKNCLNSDMIIDTNKYQNMQISSNNLSTDTKTQAPTKEVRIEESKNDDNITLAPPQYNNSGKYDLSNFGINGTLNDITISNKSESKVATPESTIEIPVKVCYTDEKENESKSNNTSFENTLQIMIEKSIDKAINKMLKGLKEN